MKGEQNEWVGLCRMFPHLDKLWFAPLSILVSDAGMAIGGSELETKFFPRSVHFSRSRCLGRCSSRCQSESLSGILMSSLGNSRERRGLEGKTGWNGGSRHE